MVLVRPSFSLPLPLPGTLADVAVFFACRDGTHDDSTPAQQYAPTVGEPPAFLNVSRKEAATGSVPATASGSATSTNVSAGVLSLSATITSVVASALFASVAGFALFV
jgi:hypothetical protein